MDFKSNSKSFFPEKKLIIKIIRRSKYILIFFENNYVMLVHLGMTGRFYLIDSIKKNFDTSFYNKKNIIYKHDHLKISFSKFNEILSWS